MMFCRNCGAVNADEATTCFACHLPLDIVPVAQDSSTLPLAAGTLLNGRYQVLNQLGSGGFGAVYKAVDVHMHHRIVAIKQMHVSGPGTQEAADAILSFRQEVQLLVNLKHPGLPVIFEAFEQDGDHYLVMDFIEGETLEDYVAHAGGKISLKETVTIALQLCDILDYLHRHHPPIIFRDLKPANVMRTEQGHLYLIDFGIARYFKPGQLKDTIAFGSPGYAAPEQYGRTQTTPRADIYSLGALLHTLLTGDDPSLKPFLFIPLSLSDPAGKQLDHLFQRMVALQEAQRPASITEVANTLYAIQALLLNRVVIATPSAMSAPAHRSGKPEKKKSARITGLSAQQDQVQVTEAAYAVHTAKPLVLSRRRMLAASLVLGACIVGGGIWLRSNTTEGQRVLPQESASKTTSTSDLYNVFWSPDRSQAAFCWSNGKVALLDVKTSTFEYSFNLATTSDEFVALLSWSPDAKKLALFYDGEPLRIWDIASRRVEETFNNTDNAVIGYSNSASGSAMAWSPDGHSIAVGSYGEMDVWRVSDQQDVFAHLIAGQSSAMCLAWSADSSRLAVAVLDYGTNDISEIQILDVQKKRQIYDLTLPPDKNTNVFLAWSPVSSIIAVCKDTTLYLFYPDEQSKNVQVKQAFQYVTDIVWSPDGQSLALASYDNFSIYDLKTGKAVNYNTSAYEALTWVPGTSHIMTVSDKGQVSVYD